MIARHWSGLCRRDKANDYIQHLLTETFKELEHINGFHKASILTKEEEEGTQFLIITLWNSHDSIKAFAGSDVETAVVPEKVQQMMIHYDSRAQHYEIRKEFVP